MTTPKFKSVFAAGQWRRNDRELVKLGISLGDTYFASIRSFARDVDSGELKATYRGIEFPIDQLPKLVKAAVRALRRARKNGWIPEEEEQ
jgi:hypothetical protein